MDDVSENHQATAVKIAYDRFMISASDEDRLLLASEIAAALANAEREGMKRAADIARDEAERSKNSIILPVVANMIAERILIEAGED